MFRVLNFSKGQVFKNSMQQFRITGGRDFEGFCDLFSKQLRELTELQERKVRKSEKK
jgi:hypothetical protein